MNDLAAAVAAFKQYGTKAAAARALGIPVNTLKSRLEAAERIPASLSIKGRKELYVENGRVIVFSDAHYWPGPASVAHRALIRFCDGGIFDIPDWRNIIPSGPTKLSAHRRGVRDDKLLALPGPPRLAGIVCNGDAIDGSAISRHPPIGWESSPSVKEELEICQERLGEIGAHAGEGCQKIWLLGNHDARFETRLAQVAPEFRDVHGIHLKDHFPDWECGWSLFINDTVVVKHRFKGGVHAPYNNALHSGMSMVTGHLHSAKVTPITDYRGIRYGVDTGCLADCYAPAFQGYLEDNPRNWRSGFCILTFRDGQLLMPELVMVWDEETVQFRGELIKV